MYVYTVYLGDQTLTKKQALAGGNYCDRFAVTEIQDYTISYCDSLNAIEMNVQKYIGGAKEGSRILDNADNS